MWLPQWLEERPEVSEKAKKLYAYLTYFAGGKGYAWPSFNHLAGKLHISRRYVIKLVQELSAHGLIVATSVNVPTKGHCTNHYRFLWHPWMQTVEDGDFRMVVREEKPPFRATEFRLIRDVKIGEGSRKEWGQSLHECKMSLSRFLFP